ncbi:hypothetical protein P7F88_25015 [Vibrio hannami]|uniref:hypothetical protein n=1 Tax=Vibrio hannami TaxID=2717094 RepID=UPI00240F3BA5|nr:hypothetical protein [Vibrio hannami]MDG3089125.1 hypothetical protein [Vibrio hannami]
MNRLGTVKEVVGNRIVVDYGNGGESPLIRWSSLAGEFSSWRAPSIGEQVIVINYAAGDDETCCLALVGFYSDTHPSKSEDASTAHMRWLDFFDATVSDDGVLKVMLKKEIIFDAGEKIVIKAGQQIVMNAGQAINVSTNAYTRTASTATTKGEQTQTGKVSIKGALDVSQSVKTPAITSYAPGAFSMDANGATISAAKINSCTVNGKAVDGHDHDNTADPF